MVQVLKKPKKLLGMLKGLDMEEIQRKAELHDEVTTKILELVNEIHKNQQKIMEKVGVKCQ